MSRVVTIEEEIADTRMGRPHVVLLGAGASRAALPDGDVRGRPVPLLRELANSLGLSDLFPDDLRELAETDFESAYSRLFERKGVGLAEMEACLSDYFADLELPERPNLYDVLTLSLREKDAILTFNWDPFLMQSRLRLARLGAGGFPRLFFLHGNVAVGFCRTDRVSGLVGACCRTCGRAFEASRLLFPVEKKNYQDGGFVEREWEAVRACLGSCFMLTVFGYSAPKTDVEAIGLLRAGWGDPADRAMEQTEIITRPGFDEDALRQTWDGFIHTHHYEIHGSFFDSWLAKHPRRSGEAYLNQYWDAKFISDNPLPREASQLSDLLSWFEPLLKIERAQASP